ncbi:MAG TPA: hypothetical protein VGC10_03035 [Sphingomonas sp.]
MPTDVLARRRTLEKGLPSPPAAARDGVAARDLAPAAALLVAGLIGLLMASLSGSGRSGQYLVIAAPWSSLGQTINLIRFADGGLVEAGRFQNIAIAGSSHADFAERARDAGAWLVVPSPKIAGCPGVPTEISPQ